MTRRVREVRDMEIDEVSLVDRPANQFAKVAIAKRAPEEETVPEYLLEDGSPVDFDQLPFGSTVYDEEGNEFEWLAKETEEVEEERELESVGKSLAEQVREDLAKALTEVERNETITKALNEVSKADARAKAAEEIAKSERRLRLSREYIAKAAEYNVPIAPTELGPVLMHLAEAELEGSLPKGCCDVVHKALDAAGELIYAEIGFQGGGDNEDVMSRVEAQLQEQVSKAADGVTKEQLLTKAFETDPDLYEQYLLDRANR